MKVLKFFFAFFVSWSLGAQESSYSQQWKEVEALELRGQVASALVIVDQIRKESKGKAGTDFVKASIFRWKFLKITIENAENTILQEVNSAIEETQSANRALFYTIKAKLVQDYFENNRYRNQHRSSGAEKADDLTMWSSLELVKESITTYQLALKDKKTLLATPADAVSDLLNTVKINRMYKPTLYDVIAQEAMGFYKSSLYGVTRPSTIFEITNTAIFKDSDTFRSWDFKSQDSLVSKFNAVKLLQELEEVHAADTDRTAFVFAQLERLAFAKANYARGNTEELYEEGLVALSRKHKKHSIHGLIQYALASHYVDLAPKSFQKEQDPKKLSYYSTAETICNAIIAQCPNSQAAVKATQLRKEIQQVSLTVQVKSHVLPEIENRILVSYRNIDSLRMRIVKMPASEGVLSAYNLPKKVQNILSDETKRGAIKVDKILLLPKTGDINHHTVEFLLPGLAHGYYIVYLSNDRLDASQSYAFARVEVSDFGYKRTDYDDKVVYQWYDRVTGQPLKDLKITTQGEKKTFTTEGATDTLGEYTIKRPKRNNGYRNNSFQVTAVRQGDTLSFRERVYAQYAVDQLDPDYPAKTELFLDRGIYRPGQTMYFKGIVLKEIGKKSQVVANEKVTLFIEDSNYEEIYKKEFVTNAYGSFSGVFQLPENVLAGEFNIYTEEGDDEESKFWDATTSYNDGVKYFRVEAYKRPTFEITYDDVTRAFQPNDSITISGNAKAFLGANVTDAAGQYTVTRSKFNRYWYYFGGSNSGRQIDQGEFKTDNNGNFTITFKAAFEDQSLEAIFQFNVSVKITDLNGETQEESTTIKVGKKNLYTTLTDPKQVTGGQPIVLTIENKNLNDIAVTCDNTLRIFKVEAPERVLFERLWETPEYQEITEDDFSRAFPNEPYETDSIPRPHGKKVYEGTSVKQAGYEAIIATDTSWEAGEYVIEHIAQDNNGTTSSTHQRFTLVQPKNTYLPADQLFSFKVLNKNPKKNGFVQLRLKTSLKNLPVFVNGFYGQDRFFAEKVDVNGNETIKIPLDVSYENSATVRVNYAQYDRFFTEDIAIDLSEPKEFLQIETESFRSKLYPDSKEQWSFKITNQNDKKVQAEVLASMYDKALDNFASSYWNSDIAFKPNTYTSIPSIPNYEQYVATFQVRIKEPRVLRYRSSFDRVNYFGLSFGNDYQYRQYLNKLRQRRADTIGKAVQEGSLSGIVLDASGRPLPGANVLIKGTEIGTQTDIDGQFSIDVDPTDVLIISFVGFETQEVVASNALIYVLLEVDKSLDEVVVTALGVQRERKALGYAVSQVSSVEIMSDNEELREEDLSGAATNAVIRGYNSIDGSEKRIPKNLEGEVPNKKINFKKVKIRTNLQETAFFYPHLTTNRKGEIRFTFDAPQLLTRWKFRLLAHNKNVLTGGLEKEVITQKDLSIVPNVPRFLREGDRVQLSAKIANLTKNEMAGAAQLQLFDAVTMQAVDTKLSNTQATQNFMIDAYGNASVFWEITIPIGMQAVTYRMVAKAGTFSDGEENILPVLPNRMMVTETVPFLVRAGQEKTVQMNHLLENTSTTLKHQQFALEYTANPSWYALQSLPYLMEFPHECAEQTFSRVYANSLSAKVLNSNPKIKDIFTQWKGDGVIQSPLEKNEDLKTILIAETPWLRNALSETARKKRLGLLFDLEKNAAAQTKALSKLSTMQNSDGGFPWFSGGRSNTYITRHIVSGMGHLQKLGIRVEAKELLERAIEYLDSQLENEFTKYVARGGKKEEFYQRRSHLHYLYARSFFAKAYPIPSNVQDITNKAVAIYNREWLDNSVYEKGLLAMVNYRLGKTEMAQTILTGLKESAVQSEINGMYWKENRSGWYWYQAPIETHSLLIEAFDEVMKDQKTVAELKIWLIQQKRTSDWKTTKATAAATYALLLSGAQFTDLDDSVSFVMDTAAAQEKINTAPREAGTGYVKATWKADEVTQKIAKTTIKNKGTSVGYGGLYWQYFEDLDKIDQGEKQILNVSKKLYLLDDMDPTAPLVQVNTATALKLGQTVRVQLSVKTASTMEFVHLKDMRASGLEPVDVLSKHNYQDGLSYYQTTRDSATHFFFDRLPQGTYVLEYDLRVNNKGLFSNGISTIQSMYAPEFSGYTAGKRVKVE